MQVVGDILDRHCESQLRLIMSTSQVALYIAGNNVAISVLKTKQVSNPGIAVANVEINIIAHKKEYLPINSDIPVLRNY